MINHLSTVFIGINLCLLIKSSIVQTERIKRSQEISVENQFQTVSTNHLQIWYLNDIQNHSILVWFTIEKSLNEKFDLYRFILRSIDHSLALSVIIETLTNFTKLIDLNNSLRMFNLDSGQYEVCVEFQSNSSTYIYQPRDGCILIPIGESIHESFKHNPASLLITLASVIVLFFILGLVVQWVKAKRRKQFQDNDKKPRSRSSSIISSITLKQQRDYIVRNFFHRHIDQPRSSRMRQWARNRAFRHRISTQEQEFEKPISLRKWSQYFVHSIGHSSQPQSGRIAHDRIPSLESNLTTDNIYTISEKGHHHQMSPRNISFHLTTPEENEMM